MKSIRKREHCFRSTLVIITTSACISTSIFIYLQFTDREKNLETISKENFFQSEKLIDEKCIPVCDSRNCITQADILLRNINPSADPCKNSQKFLCGMYEDKTGPYENNSMMLDMTNIMMNKLKNIIQDIQAEPESPAAKLKTVYDSCINLGSSELEGIEHLRQFLSSVEIYNWPYLAEDFKFSSIGLPKVLGTFRAYHEITYFGIGIEPTSKVTLESNETYAKIFFIGYDLNDTFPDRIVRRDAAMDILKYFPMESEDRESLLNDFEVVRNDLISFNKECQYHGLCEENCSDVWIDCASPENDDWGHVCEMVQIYFNVTNLKQYVSKNKIAVSVYGVQCLQNMIPRLNSLSDRSVANFFAVTLLWQHLDEVNFFFRRQKQKYFNYFKSEDRPNIPRSNKWEYCIEWIAEKMNIVLENELVKSYLSRPYIDEIHDFHQSFTSAVIKAIDEQEWISPAGKYFMKEHIKNLGCNMVFLQQFLPNDAYLNSFLKEFKPTKTNFFQNSLEYMKNLIHMHTIFAVKHDRDYKLRYIANAMTDESHIVLDYGLFLPPVYFPGHEKFINYILTAPLIIHEIGHNINRILGMISESSNITKDSFFARKQCIENQFSNFKFTILDESLNGTRYFDENLSDNLGFAIGDKMIDELDSTNVFSLPGLPYSPRQLLYMNTRQVFCSKISRKMEIHFQTDDKHAPSEYRIIASVQNSKGYSEAFSCPEGSYMNPVKKCTLFDII